MKLTQEQLIKMYLADRGDWVESWELIMKDTGKGFLGSSADRKARLLAERGEIERDHKGKYARYRVKQEPEQLTLI